MKIITTSKVREVGRLIDRRLQSDPEITQQVTRIVRGVQRRGDRALFDYARRFDRVEGPIEVSRRDIEAGARDAVPAVRKAIKTAARNIRRIASRQLPKKWKAQVMPGVIIEQRVTPLDAVGCYVPGGRYPLPSSLLMTAIPARVAGVRQIIAVCPRPDPGVLAAAVEAGVSRLFRIGGAHTIAALAYGTETIPSVDKIVGPGNVYVAAAKRLVSSDCPIDFTAGPSEIVVVARNGYADWIAADLVAQAEHDPDARAILITPSEKLARDVARAVRQRLGSHDAARPSIAKNGVAIVTRDLDEAVVLANRIAPEHLVCDSEAVARRIRHAGTVFVGPFSAQAAGDYATGSNHVLPTSGTARFRGGLNASDFVRVHSVQRLTKQGLRRLAPTVISLANAEGLRAHAASVATRIEGTGS